jgi:mRNA-degrading endonuclease RelE of RelBE toxin-antitoxin system
VYQIIFSRRAKKELLSFSEEHRIHIELALKKFAASPDQRHDVVKIKDSPKDPPAIPAQDGRIPRYVFHSP